MALYMGNWGYNPTYRGYTSYWGYHPYKWSFFNLLIAGDGAHFEHNPPFLW